MYACNTYSLGPNLENVFLKTQTHQTEDEMHKSDIHPLKIVEAEVLSVFYDSDSDSEALDATNNTSL